jgi:hypothetical protein
VGVFCIWYDAATMAKSPDGAQSRRGDPKAARSPQTSLIAQTAKFATSQVVSLTTFFGAMAASAYAYRKLPTALDVSSHLCAVLVAAVLALFFFVHTLPTMLEKWRKDRLWLSHP